MAFNSITLQGNDGSIEAGDILGRLNWAASNESDGSVSIEIAASIIAEAEETFNATNNSTSLVFHTASDDTADAKLKITSSGHFIPITDESYDLGSDNYYFRNAYVSTYYGDHDGPIISECRNDTGSTISAGTPVYISGYYSANGKPQIAPADASNSSKMPAVGIMATSLNTGTEGHFHAFGIVTQINTASFSVGDTVYVDIGGGLTNSRPSGNTDLVQNLGRVLRSDSSQGRILILGPGRTNDIPNSIIVNGTISAANIGTGTDNSVVVLNSSGFLVTDEIDSRVWGSSLVDGTGTANYLSKWSDSDTLTNSIIYDDGTYVGIATDNPSHKLEVIHAVGDCGLLVADTDGSGVKIGDCAYSTSDAYTGMTHTNFTNSNEYMIISSGNHTYVSAKDNYSTLIRAGGNNTTYQLEINASFAAFGAAGDLLKIDSTGTKAKNLVYIDSQNATNLSVGWYTIALNSGNRATGRFGLTCESSGRHQGIVFYASHFYGNGNQISVIHNNRYSLTNPVAKVRLKEGGTYDGCLLQVYIDEATNTPKVFLLNDNINNNGWTVVDWVADGTDPSTVNSSWSVGNFSALTNIAAEVNLDDVDFGTTGNFQAGSINVNGAFTFPTSDGTLDQILQTDGAGNVSWVDSGAVGSSSNLVRGSFEPTTSTSTYTVSGGYNVGTLNVYLNGVKLFDGDDYTATNGSTFTLTNAATSGDKIDYWGLNSATSATGNTTFGSVTANAGQTSFSTTGYTNGGLVVFVNGVKMVDGSDFTATNGSSFTLSSAASAGDIVDYIAYGAVVASTNLQKTGDTMTGNLTVNADLIVKGYKETHVDNGNTGTSQTISISNSTLQTYTLTGNCTFTMPTADAGRSFTVFLKTGVGSYTASFTNVKWPQNSAPTITTSGTRMDILTFYSDGTNWYGNVAQDYYL